MPEEKTDAQIWRDHHTDDGRKFDAKDQCQCDACKRYRAPKSKDTTKPQQYLGRSEDAAKDANFVVTPTGPCERAA